jgi:hypothetical protein
MLQVIFNEEKIADPSTKYATRSGTSELYAIVHYCILVSSIDHVDTKRMPLAVNMLDHLFALLIAVYFGHSAVARIVFSFAAFALWDPVGSSAMMASMSKASKIPSNSRYTFPQSATGKGAVTAVGAEVARSAYKNFRISFWRICRAILNSISGNSTITDFLLILAATMVGELGRING